MPTPRRGQERIEIAAPPEKVFDLVADITRTGFTTLDARTGRHETRWRYAMEPSARGTFLTESFEFLWCSVANRTVEIFLPRGRQMNRGIHETLARIKQAAESTQ
jgi:hypothetical protein